MSIAALTLALYHSKATYSNRLVLIAIANFEGEHGAYPSLETVGRLAGGLNRRTVQRSIDALVELGELTEVRRDGVTNLYKVTIACPDECDGTSYHRKKKGGGLQTTPVQIVHEGVASTTEGGGVQTTGGAVSRPPETLNKHNLNVNRNSSSELPEDWSPDEELMAMFKTKWKDIQPEYHIEQFKLYYWSKGTKMKDWRLTFQRWMNTEQSRAESVPSWKKSKESEKEAEKRRLDEWIKQFEDKP